MVGKSFGVFKLQIKEYEFDFSLPRTERKVAKGHRGFEIEFDAFLSFQKASLRRDFTINSLGYDWQKKQFLDPNNGLKDLKNRVLRHISDDSFVEDSLRVYRAAQFCARFEFTLHSSTFKLCKKVVATKQLEELSSFRIFEEFRKLLLRSKRPSLGFLLLKQLGVLKYFPELNALVVCTKELKTNQKLDIFKAILMAIDEMAKQKIESEFKKLCLMLATIAIFFNREKNIEESSKKATLSFLQSLTQDKKISTEVVKLVENFLAPFELFKSDASSYKIKKLATKVDIQELCLLVLAYCKGCEKEKSSCKEVALWLLKRATLLNVQNSALKPLVLGRDLIALKYSASKEFKTMLAFAYELQLQDENITKKELLEAVLKAFKTTL